MSSKVLARGLMAATLGLVVVCVYQYALVSDLEDRLAAAEASLSAAGGRPPAGEPAPAKPLAEAERAGYEETIAALEQQVTALKAVPAPPAPPAPSPRERKRANPLEGVAKMMENPAMAKMIRDQQKVQVETMFASLFKQFNLEGEELENFKGLLLDKHMGAVEVGMAMMNGDLTDEGRQEIADNLKAFNEQMDADIRKFLNDDEDFEAYEFFTQTQGERMQVDTFKQSLTGADLALDEGVEDQLVRMMYEERKSFDFSTGLHDQENFNPRNINASAIETHLGDMAALNQKILARAGELLDADQLAAFQKSQDTMREMQVMGMKMAQQMFGGEDGGGGAPAPGPVEAAAPELPGGN